MSKIAAALEETYDFEEADGSCCFLPRENPASHPEATVNPWKVPAMDVQVSQVFGAFALVRNVPCPDS